MDTTNGTHGRLVMYIEPRDAWIGLYLARDAVYVCLLPFLVIRWQRRASGDELVRRGAHVTR